MELCAASNLNRAEGSLPGCPPGRGRWKRMRGVTGREVRYRSLGSGLDAPVGRLGPTCCSAQGTGRS